MYKYIMEESLNPEKPTFIVQNVTLSYHYVSDINMQFAPREVKDLTWDDENIIKKSRNLKDSLRSGILKKLTPEEYEKTMEMQYQKEKKQLLREQQQNEQFEKMRVADKEIDAETFDINKSKKKSGELDLSGTANHPMSYVAAYEIAANLAADHGDVLSAEEFAEIVEGNPNIVPQLLSQNKSASLNAQSFKKVYYAQPQGEHSNSVGVVESRMTNYNQQTGYTNDALELKHKASYIKDAVNFDDFDNSGDSNEDFAETIIIEE